MAGASYIIGVGMTRFEKPESRDWQYPEMVRQSVTAALDDARIAFDDVEQAAVGYCLGPSTSGQRALYEVGLAGRPIYNVNNNCSTGSTALFLAHQLVAGGQADCVLAVGFEKMTKGPLGGKREEPAHPLNRHVRLMQARFGSAEAPLTAQMFGNAAREHMERYGSRPEHFAKVAAKNHRHSVHNPNAQFQREYTLEEINASPSVYDPLTRLQCCPTSDGSAAALVASRRFVEQHQLTGQAVPILAMAMATDTAETFDSGSMIDLVGADMTRRASRAAYEASGIGPQQLDVIELHDCFSANELITYEALGLCGAGEGASLIDSGAVTYGGRWVVNPSGGLISKGHPLGATGLAQCHELTQQLRGRAAARQVPGATHALQHNLGLGGAAVVAIYGPPSK